jgi:O-antigen ligase
VLGTALLLTGSRSGMGALAVVVTVLSAVAFRRLPTRGVRVTAGVAVPALLLATLAWAGLGPILSRFGQVSVEIQDRILVWQDSLRMIADFPIAGVGLGAFGTAMAVYQTAPRHTLFVQAHNDYLQIAAEGGLLVGVPALIVIVFVVQGIWRRFRQNQDEPTRYWMRAGALAGLCGIAAQSLVEFSLQKPGNAVLFVLLLALALHRPSDRLTRHADRV